MLFASFGLWGILLAISLLLQLLTDYWELAEPIQAWGFLLAMGYFVLWGIRPIVGQKISVLRLAVGACLFLFCWIAHTYFSYSNFEFFYLRVLLVSALFLLLIIGGVYWLVPKERQTHLIDAQTLVRVPQLLHIVWCMSVIYYCYGDLLLN